MFSSKKYDNSNRKHRINFQIRVPKVRVILDGQNLGVVPTNDALSLARERGLDLVEVSPQSQPPVCHILDYGKFNYEQKKKERKQQQKQRQSQMEWKEIQMTPVIASNDIETKVRQLRSFLEDGKHVRVVMRPSKKGRRQALHMDEWRKTMDSVVNAVRDVGKIDHQPQVEGTRMVAQIIPLATNELS